MVTEHNATPSEQNQATDIWRHVTPLSKYLAMTLFVLLPFVGGYVGYVYAPEKTIEFISIVEIEKQSNVKTNEEESDASDWINTEVIYRPSEYASVAAAPTIPPESSIGTVVGIVQENDKMFIGIDEVKFYLRGGSCWSISGYCIVNTDKTLVKLELEPGARLTRNGNHNELDPCKELTDATHKPDIIKDALNVDASCSGTINSNTQFSGDQLYWLIFTDNGTVRHIVEQYIP